MRRIALFLLLACAHPACAQKTPQQMNAARVLPGVDVLAAEGFAMLRGKRVGLITNPTGVNRNLVSTVDVLHDAPQVTLAALFGPEHGVRGNIFDGVKIGDTVDEKTGVPVFSLYGKTRKPTASMLGGIDVLVYDIQDAGYRPYTYIYTMAYAMQAAAEHDIAFVVLDRPSPLGAERIEGPILEEKFSSFIGLYPIPYLYGMTVGELARYFNGEYEFGTDLTVVPMQHYARDMLFEETGLHWVPTSPHIPHPKSALLAATLGNIGELHTVSEGVGTTLPFEIVAAPWLDPDAFARAMNARQLPGVRFRPAYVRHYYKRLADKEMPGVQLHVTDARGFSPMRIQLHLMAELLASDPQDRLFKANKSRLSMFFKAIGTRQVLEELSAGGDPDRLMAGWESSLQRFRHKRQRYLLY